MLSVCVVCVACSLGDLVTLAKQAKFFMKKPAAAKPLPATPSCGFTLAKRPSSISGAGEGVFIQVCLGVSEGAKGLRDTTINQAVDSRYSRKR
jgi:hypothetical protein